MKRIFNGLRGFMNRMDRDKLFQSLCRVIQIIQLCDSAIMSLKKFVKWLMEWFGSYN